MFSLGLSTLKNSCLAFRQFSELYTDLSVSWHNRDSIKENFMYYLDFTTEPYKKWLKEKVYILNVVHFIIKMQEDSTHFPLDSVYLRAIYYMAGIWGSNIIKKHADSCL